MTIYFITRHAGAVEWAKQQGLAVDQMLSHLDIQSLRSGDTVIGTLPVHMVAELTELGVKYLHLTMDLPEHLRGKELSAADMQEAGVFLQAYQACKVD